MFDPFGTNGVGTNVMLTGVSALATPTAGASRVVRASNNIGYFLPANLGGFYGQVNYWFGENDTAANPAVRDNGDGYGLRLGYGAGPFNVALGYSKTNDEVVGDFRQMNIGGSWDFGMAKLMAQYSRDKVGNPLDVDGRGWLLGALVPVGAGEIRASYSTYRFDTAVGEPRVKKLALGYVHNLSKRTALYATVAHLKNSGGAALTVNSAAAPAVNDSSTGLDLGIRHSF